jgi:ssDNA-binding Zn-finger/Zn-ribbon topoisomerase 1
MVYFLIIVVVLLVGYVLYSKFISNNESENTIEKVKENEFLPYKKRDDFLTEAERSFYFTLKVFLENKAVICPKVSLKDIIFINKCVGKDYMKYFGKIAKKHVDFILCEPLTMKTICGVELDDSSHSKANRQQRDVFVDKVFEAANFKLVHIPLKNAYSFDELKNIISTLENKELIQELITNTEITTGVNCPKCGVPMLKRKSTKGENAGKEFYGCPNFPKCREIRNID